jgi:PAS domain S-box-containing protein
MNNEELIFLIPHCSLAVVAARMNNAHSHTSKGSILVVDDVPMNLRFLMEMLTAQGYAVRPAPSGALALESARITPPDLILLDIKMPEMDGYTVCEHLKADARTRDIPVIFISILDDILDKVKAFSLGGVDYITKPVQTEEVLARVGTHLTLRNLQKRFQDNNTRLEQEIVARQRIEEVLRKAHDELEMRVQERTQDLQKLNEAFQAEIAERKRIEKILELNRLRVEQLLAANPAVIYTADVVANRIMVTFVSDNLTQRLGYESKEVKEDPMFWFTHIHPDDAMRGVIGISLLFERGYLTHEYRFRHKDGTYRWLQDEMRLVRDAKGNPMEVIGSWFDITERKQAEEQLLQLKKAVDTMLLGVTIADLDGKIIYTNPAEAALHGYQTEELLGKDVNLFVPPEFRKPFTLDEIKNWKGLMRESVNIRKDGSTFPVWSMSEIVKGTEGEPTAIVTSCEDITERKRAEEEFRQYREHLEKLVAERTVELQKEIAERERAEQSLRASEERLRSVSDSSIPMILPPKEELLLLYRLALIGDILEIRARVEAIDKLGPQYAPFAAKVRKLAEDLQLLEIQQILKQYVET